jgi:hypothetical protein
MQLADKLKEVVEDQIATSFDSCSLMLMPAAGTPDKLQLVAEEKGVRQDVPHMLAADSGWTISADGVNVELTGKLCDDAKSGRFDALTFEYGCDMLPPLPPNPPLQ